MRTQKEWNEKTGWWHKDEGQMREQKWGPWKKMRREEDRKCGTRDWALTKRGNSLDSFRMVLSSGTKSFCIILADASLSPVGYLTRQTHFPPYVVRPRGCFKAEIIQEICHIAWQIPGAGRKSNCHDLNFSVFRVCALTLHWLCRKTVIWIHWKADGTCHMGKT